MVKKVAFIPIDNRPVCYDLAKDISEIDKEVELLIPSRSFFGDLQRNADADALINWLDSLSDIDSMILSLDTLAYGGLIPSRRSNESIEDIKSRMLRVKKLLEGKKVYAFSSIMRISNNNYNEEEKTYWSEYGKKIFEYSYLRSKGEKVSQTDIPEEILDDYLKTRRRNFEINKMYLEWQKEGLFETLIFSKDDCAEFGFNVDEARELESLGGKTKTGADEIPLTLLARSIDKQIRVYPKFLEPEYVDCISNYEDVSIKNSVSGQLELCGFTEVDNEEDADIVLIINNFIEKQGELVMGWDTKPFDKSLELPEKAYAVADVRFANGADNAFVEKLLQALDINNFYGFAAWNTSANSLGSLLAAVKFKYQTAKYNGDAFKKLCAVRFLDDWAYQANVRSMIKEPCDISGLMKPFEERVQTIFNCSLNPEYYYPWNRKFEIGIKLVSK